MKVLVCGGRDYADGHFVGVCLDELHAESPISQVIHGGARGADRLAGEWAEWNKIPCRVFRADWSYGRRAGPIRNQRMLDVGKPDVVVAFPGGAGTRDMVTIARKAGVRVIEA